MKKFFTTVILSFLFVSLNLYSFEISVGSSFLGIGFGVFRGKYAQIIEDNAKDNNTKLNTSSVSFMPVIQADVMIEFLPFLALETGLGFGVSSYTAEVKKIDSPEYIFTRSEFRIPIMIRGQFELEKFLFYGSFGTKLGIQLSENYITIKTETADSEDITEIKNARGFTVDIAFAIGGEFRVVDSHYAGLRVGYDINVLSPMVGVNTTSFSIGDFDANSTFHDNFNVSLTYRYAFNSKWN